MTLANALPSAGLKLFRSAGVPVTGAVHRLLTQANAARDVRDWPGAAAAYEQALKRDPDLAHIWIQYGHALKELGELGGSESAYRKATEIAPSSADAHLHLGHVKKLQGCGAEANRLYLAAARLDPLHPGALGELHSLIHQESELAPQDLLALLSPTHLDRSTIAAPNRAVGSAQTALAGLVEAVKQGRSKVDAASREKLDTAIALLDEIELAADVVAVENAADATPIVFDVSDLVAYFRDARLPTGIQRVQIEIISNALGSGSIQICCFLQERDAWLEIPPDIFVILCRLSLASGDCRAPEWLAALTRLHVTLSLADAHVFPAGACLINLGTSWWISNYFLSIRQAKALSGSGIRYVPFVHDLIPLLAPDCCATALTRDFVNWIVGVFQHADVFLTNSEATKRDLLQLAALLDYDVDPESVHVIALDADFRKPSTVLRQDGLASRGLSRTPFVLFVSTIEARKNHVLAFEAWLALIRKHGLKNVPKLVCVGKRGWRDDAIFAKLQAHDDLRDRVVLLSGLSDAELADLYRRCLFTIYPSTYEGWGLPVTESLCYGKTPLISNGSSLPEAGGAVAVYFEAGSTPDLTEKLDQLIYDQDHRRACEAKIKQQFRPRSWRQLADQVIEVVTNPASQAPEGGADLQPPLVELGAYHPLGRNKETRVWPGMRFAEVFRTGDGWWGQDDFGCWAKPQGGDLEIGVVSAHNTLRFYLQLQGPPTQSATFHIEVDGETAASGPLSANQHKWVGTYIAPAHGSRALHRIRIYSETSMNLADCTDGQDRRMISVGLAGFFICDADDAAARVSFLEAVTLNNLDELMFSKASTRSRGIAPALLDQLCSRI